LATRAFFLNGGEPECISTGVTSPAPVAPGKQFRNSLSQIVVLVFYVFAC